MLTKQEQRNIRHRRIRAKVRGSASRPRLCLYRSNKGLYAQIIDDDKGVTIVSGSDAKEVAKKAIEKGVSKVVFDRGGFIYTGRIKQFAEIAREAGLKF